VNKVPSLAHGRHFSFARTEPALEELLVDPIMQLLAAGDGLRIADVRTIAESARRKLRSRSHPRTSRPLAM
jgi:hypothetical protein